MRRWIALTSPCLSLSLWALGASPGACTGGSSPGAPGDVAEIADTSGSAVDVGTDSVTLPPPPTCPTSGKGALIASNSSCYVFTPEDAGAAPGVNSTVDNYALAPTTGATGHLVVFLNPSLGSPAQSIATPSDNIYTAATAAGNHVLALAYSSEQVIGISCGNNDPCYLATRTAVVTGQNQPGQAPGFTIALTEGIHERATAALIHLVQSDARDSWAQFLVRGANASDPTGSGIDWSKVIVMGHSQGGGHAALLAKLHPVARLVALSSPCDEVGTTVASWEHVDASWQAQPAQIGYGFATLTTFDSKGNPTGGDTTCPAHAAVWDALGMPQGAPHRFEDAAQCAGASAHTATTQCTANMPRVQSLVTL